MMLFPHVRRDIVRRYLAGETPVAIAAALRRSHTRVREVLKQEGVWNPRRPQRRRVVLDAAVAANHAAGWPETADELAARFGVKRGAVFEAARRQGLPYLTLRKAAVAQRYAAGDKVEAIMSEYRTDAGQIRRWAREAGVPIRKSGRPKAVKPG